VNDDRRCGRHRHLVRWGPLLLRTAGLEDMMAGLAAASDDQAQRWLGWRAEQICPEPLRTRCLETAPRDDRAEGGGTTGSHEYFAALDRGTGRLLGMVGITFAGDRRRHELGGWLAPAGRGRGLGAEMFRAAAHLAHEHLGIAELSAGTEESNIACRRSLVAAGFGPGNGPDPHILPNGRAIVSRWFQHVATAHLCREGGVRKWPTTP
jgi:RimJ/RimL family protein N-acetyltransferase